jgi:xanthine dehydrogenase molybdopterin-binding subunit B
VKDEVFFSGDVIAVVAARTKEIAYAAADAIQIEYDPSEQILERTYRTGFHEHAYLESETVMAVPDWTTEDYQIYGSIQNPYMTRGVVAVFMGLNLNKINVTPSILGGSFGGKDDIIHAMACRVTLLSKMTGKPVKLTNTREDSIKESYKRHPYLMTYKLGFMNDGTLKAMQISFCELALSCSGDRSL